VLLRLQRLRLQGHGRPPGPMGCARCPSTCAALRQLPRRAPLPASGAAPGAERCRCRALRCRPGTSGAWRRCCPRPTCCACTTSSSRRAWAAEAPGRRSHAGALAGWRRGRQPAGSRAGRGPEAARRALAGGAGREAGAGLGWVGWVQRRVDKVRGWGMLGGSPCERRPRGAGLCRWMRRQPAGPPVIVCRVAAVAVQGGGCTSPANGVAVEGPSWQGDAVCAVWQGEPVPGPRSVVAG
jgi:hypothetical protein